MCEKIPINGKGGILYFGEESMLPGPNHPFRSHHPTPPNLLPKCTFK